MHFYITQAVLIKFREQEQNQEGIVRDVLTDHIICAI